DGIRDGHVTGVQTLLFRSPVGDAAVPRLELTEWASRYGLVAGITTWPLSLGLWSDEPVGQVMGRWRAFRAAFGARFPSTVLAHRSEERRVGKECRSRGVAW